MVKEKFQVYCAKYNYRFFQLIREKFAFMPRCQNVSTSLPRKVLYIRLLYFRQQPESWD